MNGTLTMILPLIVLLAVMYFLLIRPQKKREKEFAEQERKRLNNQYITALRNGLNCFPVLSENWCQCRNELEYQLHIHDVINTERR